MVMHVVPGNPRCCSVSDQRKFSSLFFTACSTPCIKQYAKCGTLRDGPNKLLYDVTFARRFLRGEQMTAFREIRVRAVVESELDLQHEHVKLQLQCDC